MHRVVGTVQVNDEVEFLPLLEGAAVPHRTVGDPGRGIDHSGLMEGKLLLFSFVAHLEGDVSAQVRIRAGGDEHDDFIDIIMFMGQEEGLVWRRFRGPLDTDVYRALRESLVVEIHSRTGTCGRPGLDGRTVDAGIEIIAVKSQLAAWRSDLTAPVLIYLAYFTPVMFIPSLFSY